MDRPTQRPPAKGLGPRPCVACGMKFLPYRDYQRTCSRRCREAAPRTTPPEWAREVRFTCKECGTAETVVTTAGAGAFSYCTTCKPVAAQRRQDRKNAARRVATPGRREANLKSAIRRYGITFEDYETLLSTQGGRCALCRRAPRPGGIKAAARLHVDHDHTTGKVRELLCNGCNRGLGYMQDAPDLLRRAADYIERHRE